MSNKLIIERKRVMKKLYTMIMMAMMGMMAVSRTSCEDEEIAYDLEGTWRGNMYVHYEYGGRDYTSTYTEITFLKDPNRYSSGTGYWVDYYKDAPWGDYVANHIEWTVDNSVIKVYFVEEKTRMEIRDYHLGRDRFYGEIWDHGNYVEFELYHIDRPNYDSYHWYDDDEWYWSRTRG